MCTEHIKSRDGGFHSPESFKMAANFTYLTVPGLSVFPIEVGAMAVLIPPGPLVGHGTVGNGNIIVSVLCGERASLMIAEGVPYKEKDAFIRPSHLFLFCQDYLDI